MAEGAHIAPTSDQALHQMRPSEAVGSRDQNALCVELHSVSPEGNTPSPALQGKP